MKHGKRLYRLFLIGLVVLASFGAQAQSSGGNRFTPPTVKEVINDDGTKKWVVTLSDGTEQEATTQAELSRIMQDIARQFYRDMESAQLQQLLDMLNRGVNSFVNGVLDGTGLSGLLGGSYNMDQIDQELSGIIGEQVSSIMQGLTDQISDLANQLINSAVSQLINASPIGEVKSLKDLLKEGFSKQQRIDYQQYRVNYEEKKARTELSTAFTTYYSKLDLNGAVSRVNNRKQLVSTLIAKPAFMTAEKTVVQQALSRYGSVDDVVEEVKTACNLNGGTVWMSEAERVKVLEYAQKELAKRDRNLMNLYRQLANAYVYRQRDQARKQAVAGYFNPGTALNRTAPITSR